MNAPHVAVVGAGTMGANIALDFAAHGWQVALVDAQAAQLTRAAAMIQAGAELLQRHGMLATDAPAVVARVTPDLKLARAVAGAEMVVEAVPEDLALKHRVFGELERHCGDDAILASNTSSFMPSRLAEGMANPGRLIVAHYWNPAHLMPLVELVPHPGTAPGVVDRVQKWLVACGKRAVVVQAEVPGFIGNRLAFALQREAMALVEQGVATPADIDAVVRAGFGRRIPVSGVFATADLGGLDVYAAICDQIFPDLCRDTTAPAVLRRMVERGTLGVKTGAGWYRHPPEGAAALRARLEEELVARAKQDRAGEGPLT
ncbi:MAG TPA: 3-hydroxyacyl-CoA dehydrogenase family protein [Opitutaceae bacterium]|nr:3-hydroxyacyl-CoA dehydrogenase family protein [Opitutaceae bacterium]